MDDQSEKTVIVTGANSGIGFGAAKELALAGAHVVFACRTESKARAAIDEIEELGEVSVEFIPLDLSRLRSVREFVDAFTQQHRKLDLLINNAGVMIPPYTKTADGFELQFGTNHLGHFALTGLLLDHLERAKAARVVSVSSVAHRVGRINFDDPNWNNRRYQAFPAYAQSKLANLLFTFELQRRLDATKASTIATAAHPGWSSTELLTNPLVKVAGKVLAQPPAAGAWPTLAAAVADSEGGDYWGPGGFLELKGSAKKVKARPHAHRTEDRVKLWELSEKLTGVSFLNV